jgi:hypothetical protein
LKAVRKLGYGQHLFLAQSQSTGFRPRIIDDNKLLPAMKAGTVVAKIPKQALYRDLRFVNDCGKKNLRLAGKNTE